ncbi:transcriptional regulator, LacI family [Kribbella flavida DSM 17836]|uniref:Transcriptional regulator, LacI family n=1 Tax=Kribbella flavida (strain DSM 17836 / JCM 10339 / NBRC 14399) TaxID=479435 RepID=D2PUW5_KRIFD|nr:LacI family DNA-binding transcriptional regulator [Kribbella flavida]ADB31431.1 transcriptional regulator, LacI family [Kribbella flavida DSM 17836]
MPTVRDVAERAGVSIATVSFVLNGSKPVTPATRQRVEAAVAELGYHRNELARALASRKTRILALAHPTAEHRFGSSTTDFITSAARAARARGYHLVLWPIDTDGQEIHDLLGQGLVDGVVLMEVKLDDPRVDALAASGTPYALIGRTRDPAGLVHVDIDFDRSVADALDHLQDLGHREIAFVTAERPGYGPKVRSEAAYRRLCAERGLEPLLLECAPTAPAGQGLMPRLVERVTAVMLMNEYAAFGVLTGLARAGLGVPDDLSVLSFTSPDMGALADPPLTTSHSPGAELGSLGVHALIDQLEGIEPSAPRLVPCTLVPGQSTARRP